ncbi:MAG: hypothetical protein SFU84_00685 [Gemmatimonadales bacterium]|nr:hypothetical protein [Gemmatimonadales bacterium]
MRDKRWGWRTVQARGWELSYLSPGRDAVVTLGLRPWAASGLTSLPPDGLV